MDLRRLILNARRHLVSSGCEVWVTFGEEICDEASLGELSAALPVSVQQVYRQVGDGFTFRWKSADWDQLPQGDECRSQDIDFPPWQTLAARAAVYANGWFKDESFEASSVADAALARQSAARMTNWTWFYEELNGDHMCIDLATGEVVYDEHDWHDAGTGANGHMMAPDIMTFLSEWARVCFATPTGKYWPEAFLETGIDWSSGFFPRRCTD